MAIPVVIAENGKGAPVRQVDSGAPVMQVAANGLGMPIVLSDRGMPFVVVGGTPTPTPAPISAVAANGWTATMIAPSDLAFEPVELVRQGFDATGAATTWNETFYTTKRVRQAYPNQASLTTDDVALSDYILSTDTVAGVTNNSTAVSPIPIVNWTMTSRRLVGNTLRAGVTGNHWAARNGKPFACVEFTATDGTNTVTQKVSAMSVSTTGFNDQFAVLAYETDLDLSTLNDAANITVNARVYPWIGGAASVHDSSANSGAREFSPRAFRRDTAKAAAPNVVYVASTGNDSTGYVGTDPVAAAAAPCLTLTGAFNRARAVLGTGSGALDGLRVKLTEGTWSLSANPTANTVSFLVTIEPAPGAAKANTILQFGTSNFTPAVTYLRYKGLNIQRTGAFYPYNTTAGFCIFEDCSWTQSTSTGALSSNAGTLFFWNGVTFTANAGTMLTAANGSHAMIRGVDCSGVTAGNFHGFLTLGCRFPATVYARGAYSEDNSIIQFNRFLSTSANAVCSVTTTCTGFSFSQNVAEVTHTTTSTPGLRPSSDSDTNSLTHVLFDNNTLAAGHYQVGRINGFYDETVGTVRTHRFCRLSRSIVGSAYIKEDVFVGTNGNGSPNPADAPNHIGNFAPLHGVGYKGLHSLFVNASASVIGASEGPAYAGLEGSIATTQTTPQYALTAGVNFTNWQATTTNSGTGAAIAGSGGGDYSVPNGSALIGILDAADEVFPFDLAGNARDRGTIGAYR